MSVFYEFCLEHGINQQFSVPHVPQQNGVMERKNHTLVEMARTMLDEHRTPRRFWADAISTLGIFLIRSSYARFCI
jgi:transposase InsO family protein